VFFGVVALWWIFTRTITGAAGDTRSSIIGSVLVLVAFLWLAAVSVALALIDLDTHKLPDAIVLPSYFVGGVLLAAGGILNADYESLIRSGVGLAVLWAAYLAMAFLYPGGMGFGDVKLAGVLGMYLGFLGWGPLLVGAFAAFLLGGVFALGLILTRRASRKTGIPFGPWMLAGAWLGIFAGDSLWNSYLSLVGLA
jgi:leader peptidase (prepilin peptidase)/N-methyltransferase